MVGVRGTFWTTSEEQQIADAIVALPSQARYLDELAGAIDSAEAKGAPADRVQYARDKWDAAAIKWRQANNMFTRAYAQALENGDIDGPGLSGLVDVAVPVGLGVALIVAAILVGGPFLPVIFALTGAIAVIGGVVTELLRVVKQPDPPRAPGSGPSPGEAAISVAVLALLGLGAFLLTRRRR